MAVLMLAHVVTLHSLILLSCPHQANFWIVVLSLPLLILCNGLKLRLNWKPSVPLPRSCQNTRTIWHYAHADFNKARELIHNT